MDIRSRPRVISSVTGTKDLQNVNLSLRVLSRPEEVALPKIYQTLGLDFDDRVLPSLGNEVLKAVVVRHILSLLGFIELSGAEWTHRTLMFRLNTMRTSC